MNSTTNSAAPDPVDSPPGGASELVARRETLSPVELGLSYVRAYNRRDEAALFELYAKDFWVRNPLWAGTKTSDQVVDDFRRIWRLLPGARFEVRNVVAEGATVILEMLWVWTDPGSEPPTDHYLPVTDIFCVAGSQFTELRAYMDPAPLHGWLAQRGDV